MSAGDMSREPKAMVSYDEMLVSIMAAIIYARDPDGTYKDSVDEALMLRDETSKRFK